MNLYSATMRKRNRLKSSRAARPRPTRQARGPRPPEKKSNRHTVETAAIGPERRNRNTGRAYGDAAH